MEELNMILLMFVITLACVIMFVRENTDALDQLADWAASRSYGLKCAHAEHVDRKNKREVKV